MEKSILELLSSDESCTELTYQYRMNGELMRLANGLVYDGKLQCGSDSLASRTISDDEVDGGIEGAVSLP